MLLVEATRVFICVKLLFLIRGLFLPGVHSEALWRPLVTEFTSRSAVVSWVSTYMDQAALPSNYIIQKRRRDPDKPWNEEHEVSVGDNSTSHNITGLKPFTAYSFRIIAVYSTGVRSEPSLPSYPIITRREAPSGKPVVIRTSTLDSNRIEIVWQPPEQATMNGEFIGHVISYRRRNDSDGAWTDFDLPGNVNSTISYIVTDLLPFTDYLLRIQVKNMIGVGPYTYVRASTDEGVPEAPEELAAVRISSRWTELTWRAPRRPNGIIVGYYLYYKFVREERNFTDSRIIRQVAPVMRYNLTGLVPYTNYTVWLHAKSSRHDGRSSELLMLRTDVSPPRQLQISNVTCPQDDSVILTWSPEPDPDRPVDGFLVEAKQEGGDDYRRTKIDKRNVDGRLITMVRLSGLTAHSWYQLTVRATVTSFYNRSVILFGPPSPPQRVLLQLECQLVQRLQLLKTFSGRLRRRSWQLSSGMMAGVVCAGVAVALSLTALLIWRKYFQVNYDYLDPDSKSQPRQKPPNTAQINWEELAPADLCAKSLTPVKYPVAVDDFVQHVCSMAAAGKAGFSREFEMIQMLSGVDDDKQLMMKHEHDETLRSTSISQLPSNKSKNRYVNILAFDHTLVPLDSGSKPPSDQQQSSTIRHERVTNSYINANFIDGFRCNHAYIGTQGPMAHTVPDFWSMVYEQDVSVIVMITNVIEAGRRKCEQYWPESGFEVYRDIEVKMLGEDVMATYTIRRLNIRCLKMSAPQSDRIVYQYHYTTWPDHGIPENPLPILSFVRKSSAANVECGGPIVVHCSAGVGRTGTYIVIDSMLKMIRSTGALNIYGFLRHIRNQRNFLVQTEDQYVFIHEALKEAVLIGETDIHCSFFHQYLCNLQLNQTDCYPWNTLETQYKLVNSSELAGSKPTVSNNPINNAKNRCQQLVPGDLFRVIISPRAGSECSDYINASWLTGFNRTHEFIIAQHPLAQTIADFWQMVWDHDVPLIVLLSADNDDMLGDFWPNKNSSIEFDRFNVQLIEKTTREDSVVYDILLSSRLDTTQLSLKMVHNPGWPHKDVPLYQSLPLLTLVQDLISNRWPCVVVDPLGGLEAALFCSLLTLAKQMEFESHVDVFMAARNCRYSRGPTLWRQSEDLLLLYRLVECLLDNHNHSCHYYHQHSRWQSQELQTEGQEHYDPLQDHDHRLLPGEEQITGIHQQQHEESPTGVCLVSRPPTVQFRQNTLPKPILKKCGTLTHERPKSQVRIPPDGMESCVMNLSVGTP